MNEQFPVALPAAMSHKAGELVSEGAKELPPLRAVWQYGSSPIKR